MSPPPIGTLVPGESGGAVGVAAVTSEGPARPHLLVVATKDGVTVEVRISAAAAVELSMVLAAIAPQVERKQLAFQLSVPPEAPGDQA